MEEDVNQSKKKHYTVIKMTINNFVKDKYFEIIMDAIIRHHKIITDTYLFLKLYILNCLKKNICVKNLDQNFMIKLSRIVSISNENRGRSVKYDEELYNLYNNYFLPNKSKNFIGYNRDKLSQILTSTGKDMITAIKNNIILNFISRQKRLIDTFLNNKDINNKGLSRKIQWCVNGEENIKIEEKYDKIIKQCINITLPKNLAIKIHNIREKRKQERKETKVKIDKKNKETKVKSKKIDKENKKTKVKSKKIDKENKKTKVKSKKIDKENKKTKVKSKKIDKEKIDKENSVMYNIKKIHFYF
jgi:hypothetical protein